MPLEALGGMDGGERQEALLDVGGEHVAHAVRRRLEGHVGQERGEAPVAAGDGDEVLEVLLPFREVLAMDLPEHRRVEPDHARHLLARRHVVGRDLGDERRQPPEVLRVGAAARVGRQPLAHRLDRRRLGEVREDVVRGLGADAVEQEEHPVPGHRVAGVGDDPEMRQHVLHVRRLDELEAAALDERDVGALQLELEVEGVEARPEQDRDLVERNAFLAQLEDALADEARLRLLVGALDQ